MQCSYLHLLLSACQRATYHTVTALVLMLDGEVRQYSLVQPPDTDMWLRSIADWGGCASSVWFRQYSLVQPCEPDVCGD